MAQGTSDFALYDPAFGGCDGLFVPKRSKGQAMYDVQREWDAGVISFKGEQLTSAHQSVLLAICAQTARSGFLIRDHEAETEARQAVLGTTDLLDDVDMSYLEVSAYDLLLDAGMGTGGKDYRSLIGLLHEMSTVSVYREVPGKRKRISPLLLFPKAFEGDRLPIRLNWRLAASIFGEQNVRVSLNERRNLETPIAKVAHCWFSCFIREGQSLMAGRGASLNTLASHVWGRRPASDAVWRKRRTMLKKALHDEVGQLPGWGVVPDDHRRGVWHISRPKQAQNTNDFYLPTPSEHRRFMEGIQEGRRSERSSFEDEIPTLLGGDESDLS
jgi:hypothetical protein